MTGEWLVIEDVTGVHVVPEDGLLHDWDDCWCDPWEDLEGIQPVIVHQRGQ